MAGRNLRGRIGIAALGLLFALVDKVNAELIVGLTGFSQAGPHLILFDSAAPGVVLATVPVTGFEPLAIDVRPATSEIYALSAGFGIYKIELSGAATFVSRIGQPSGGGEIDDFDIDFDPTTDLIRMTSNHQDNLRLTPDPAMDALVARDRNLSFAVTDINAGRRQRHVPIASTNSFPGATSTRLYAIVVHGGDEYPTSLALLDPPNEGVLSTIGPTGFDPSHAGFDISGSTGIGYAVGLIPGASNYGLFTLDLSSGAGTLVGAFPNLPGQLLSIAVIPEPSMVGVLCVCATGIGGRRRAGWR